MTCLAELSLKPADILCFKGQMNKRHLEICKIFWKVKKIFPAAP
ncbi:hypothetical protein DCCM_3044 [Desulfocucumis palustris]|uniref:Uncharacterized protein n=1 Tax=Desulfocucumis palustris TaxID=1898651 RepID=A0A2L2XDZ2_9FIRM|nr:hypothetical protein DCCM_3044 [Desulfocucumis palustris]